MQARLLQQIGGTYSYVWMFQCEPGVETRYEDIRISLDVDPADSIDNYVLHIPDAWNAYCTFDTGIDTYPFPLQLADLDSVDGALTITIPMTLLPGQYAQHIQLIDVNVEGLPLFGGVLCGECIFSHAVKSIIDASTLPVIFVTVKSGFNVPVNSGGVASAEEKLAVINVLADWLYDVETAYQLVINAITALDDSSTSDDIYAAYQMTEEFLGSGIPQLTLDNAMLSVKSEALQ